LGGTNYLITAISELLSVPFANYANQAGRHPGIAGLLEGHWVTVEDNLGLGNLFIHYVSQTAVMFSYIGEDTNGFYDTYSEIILVQGSSFVSPTGGPGNTTFTVNDTQLTITVDDGGEIFTTTYERQF
jgi:hypothetical protein